MPLPEALAYQHLDPVAKSQLQTRLLAELISRGRHSELIEHGLIKLDPTPSALARRMLGDRWRHRPYHDVLDRMAVDMLNGVCDRGIVEQPPQSGKALALDTPIATPGGWSTMGDLRVGDQVFDETGKPCTVTYVSPIWLNRECYEVITGDGERIIADREHRWRARLDRRNKYAIHETHVLARSRAKNAQIESCPGLDLPDAVLPMDPYVLGAWLGDGHTSGAAITTADPEIIDRFREAGYNMQPTASQNSGKATTYRAKSERGNGYESQFITDLKAAVGGTQTSRQKHIPTEYLRGSRQQRLALLQGLIDTDGYVDPDRGGIEFCTTVEALAEGVRELVFTLGSKATVRKGRATLNGVDHGPKYRVGFMLSDAAWLPRKRERCRDSSVAGVRYVSARQVESVPVRCITVDSPSHLYLAGRSLLPTHNTFWTVWFVFWWMSHHPQDPAILMSYAAQLAATRGRMIRTLVDDHGAQFGLLKDRRQAARNNWLTTTGAGLVTGGMQTGVSGNPAAMMVIDDAFGGREDADSRVIRESTYNEYSGSLLSRLRPKAPLLIVNTRWHEADLVGRVLESEGRDTEGGRWRVNSLPAFATEDHDVIGRRIGDPLPHPWIPEGDIEGARKHWTDKRRTSTMRDWSSLYQCDPQPPEGALLTEEQIHAARLLGSQPEYVKTVVAVDPSGGGRDNAGIVAGGKDWSGRVVWTHDLSGHMSIDEWPERACQLAHDVQAAEIVYEQNYGKDMVRRLIRTAWEQLQTRGVVAGPCPRLVPVNAKVGKRLRAEPIAQLVITGGVQFAGLGLLGLEETWATWQEDSHESPGDLDASVYAAYRLASMPGAESFVTNISDRPKEASGRSKLAAARISR
jgi:hypothetical protein